ncbi:MAG: DUF3047 domain-containing protein, partial [Burkholderiales bacterium]
MLRRRVTMHAVHAFVLASLMISATIAPVSVAMIAAARDASPIHLDAFSRLAAGTFPEQGTEWTRFALRDRPATTAFTIVADGDERVLALESDAGVAALRHAVRVEPNEPVSIAWRWRVIMPATAGRLGAKGTDDFAAR